jgi:hypothetical protein
MSKPIEIEQYLEILDGIRRAEPKPFFTGRVMSRLRSAEPTTQNSWTRWGLSLSILTLLILINVMLFVFQSNREQTILSEYDQTTPDWVMEYTANPTAPIYDNLNK